MNRLTRKTDGRDYCRYCHQVEFDNEVLGRNDPLLYENPQDFYNEWPYQTSEVGNEEEILNKLGKLEDLEEGLGIDLITLFKALKEGIYITKDGYVHTGNIEKFDDKEKYNCLVLNASYDNNYYLSDISHPYGDSECGDIGCYVNTKDYGKTWALTREELIGNE